uniref:Large ribosomal subunit protein bL33c n=1 Tax=Callithamnion tetricum TaxID=193179 RepID=A0A4D6WNS1_9FLOR|nr:ribosomal protein L33 [Callithamnion tetricum]
MGKSKGARIIITLECECRSDIDRRKTQRKSGIFRYTTTKNKRNTPSRIQIRKYCPKCNQHKCFKEIK